MREQLPCEVMFGQERGGEIRAQLEESVGEPCPCLQGESCLLLRPMLAAT